MLIYLKKIVLNAKDKNNNQYLFHILMWVVRKSVICSDFNLKGTLMWPFDFPMRIAVILWMKHLLDNPRCYEAVLIYIAWRFPLRLHPEILETTR